MKIETETVFKLTMTKEEARWLMEYLQNPPCHPDEEDPKDASMREKFFKHLGGLLR